MLRPFSVFILLLFSTPSIAQPLTQTIRGTVVDEASNRPLAFAAVGLQNTSIGTTTDSLGNFTLKEVPIGRYNIVVSILGYSPALLREIQISSAKEVVLNISMKENTTTLKEVVVKQKVNKEQPLNSMATVSARMLSVEEAKRYAGGF